jgi:hypothetical protein
VALPKRQCVNAWTMTRYFLHGATVLSQCVVSISRPPSVSCVYARHVIVDGSDALLRVGAHADRATVSANMASDPHKRTRICGDGE